jgi:hypothetical protein
MRSIPTLLREEIMRAVGQMMYPDKTIFNYYNGKEEFRAFLQHGDNGAITVFFSLVDYEPEPKGFWERLKAAYRVFVGEEIPGLLHGITLSDTSASFACQEVINKLRDAKGSTY